MRLPQAQLFTPYVIVSMLASGIAVIWLQASGVSIDAANLLLSVLVMSALVGLNIVYTDVRPDPIVSNLSGAVAVITWSAWMAGVISLAGLRFGAPLIDAHLAALDRMLGLEMKPVVEVIAQHEMLGLLLGFAYLSSFPLLFGVAVFLAVTRRFEQLHELALVFALTIVVSAVISSFIPALGTFVHYGLSTSVVEALPAGSGVYHLEKYELFRNGASPTIALTELQGVVTFPSFHCCLALMTGYACRGSALSLASWAWNGVVIVSTIPIGGHYAIDLLAGAALWMTATAFAQHMSLRSPGIVAAPRSASDLF
jgi:hypothetical protein